MTGHTGGKGASWPTGAQAVFAAGGLLACALTVLFMGARWVCPDGVCGAPPSDHALLRMLDARRGPVLDASFAAWTWFGSLFVLGPVAVLVAARQRMAGHSVRAAVFVPIALVGAAFVSRLVKEAVSRPRPDAFALLGPMPLDASFPSAHTMQAAALALAWLLRPGAVPRAGEAVAAIVLVTGVGLSRMYLQVHFPSDVLAGALSAIFWVLALRCLPVWGKPAR
jgi:undecaprenyl-diphosphatase